MWTPDQPLNPPEYPTTYASFTVTRVYTFTDVELEGVDNHEDLMNRINDIAKTETGTFEEQIVELEEVVPMPEH
jgi:hypothetical protein